MPPAPSIHCLSLLAQSPAHAGYAVLPFYYEGRPLDQGPRCALSLARAGSMRFRFSETNQNRAAFFDSLGLTERIIPLELIHSRIVYAAEREDRLRKRQGDGLITLDAELVPVLTVADCMPIYLFDPKSGCFGVLHSGWKGTGIVLEALRLAQERWSGRPENMCVVLGPHIHECCYCVDEERAAFFERTYTPRAVRREGGKNHLSLAEANIALLLGAGVRAENIVHCTDCTCCSPELGSFRRETAGCPPDLPLETRLRRFTAMAAFAGFGF